MPYAEHIKYGISYLLNCQNDDGGIKIACRESTNSGVWTTAEALDAILVSDCLQFNLSNLDNLFLMVDYLLKKFIINEEDANGYWEIADGEGPSTMSTGHSVFSLQTFSNKILSNCDLEEVVIGSQRYVIKDIRNAINKYSNMGINWLICNQQFDGGWSYTSKNEKKPSALICGFYVLKGFKSVGKNSQNDQCVNDGSVYIKEKIQTIIRRERGDGFQLPEVLYGYTSLNEIGYFTKSENDFKNTILKYIRRQWRFIKKQTVLEFNSTLQISEEKYTEYVNNLPYIVLLALITTEEYGFNRKINSIVNKIIQLKNDMEWCVYKNGKKETTWLTAEVVIALSLAQHKYVKYQRTVENRKKVKTLKIIISILGVLCSTFFVYYIVQILDTSNIAQSILSILVAFLGVVSSLISIIEVFRK